MELLPRKIQLAEAPAIWTWGQEKKIVLWHSNFYTFSLLRSTAQMLLSLEWRRWKSNGNISEGWKVKLLSPATLFCCTHTVFPPDFPPFVMRKNVCAVKCCQVRKTLSLAAPPWLCSLVGAWLVLGWQPALRNSEGLWAVFVWLPSMCQCLPG